MNISMVKEMVKSGKVISTKQLRTLFSQDKSNTKTKKTSLCEWRYSDVKE